MSRLFVTGDTHNYLSINKLSRKNFPLSRELDKRSILVVLGDFGFPWDGSRSDEWWLDWCNDLPFSLAFCDGNHVNFNLLNEYPVEEWNGGKTHVLRPHVRHLMRGEIFDLNGFTCFCFGGAASTDKHLRTEGKNWWPEEEPSRHEINNAVDNLLGCGMNVDFIFSHTSSNRTIEKMGYSRFDTVTNFLEKFVETDVQFKHNYFGHMHQDRVIDSKHTCVYYDILEILPNGESELVAHYKG